MYVEKKNEKRNGKRNKYIYHNRSIIFNNNCKDIKQVEEEEEEDIFQIMGIGFK